MKKLIKRIIFWAVNIEEDLKTWKKEMKNEVYKMARDEYSWYKDRISASVQELDRSYAEKIAELRGVTEKNRQEDLGIVSKNVSDMLELKETMRDVVTKLDTIVEVLAISPKETNKKDK